jgi:N utilization substance protein B
LKRSGRNVGKRRMTREIAVQMLYQVDLGGSSPQEAIHSFDLLEYLRAARRGADEDGEAPAAVGAAELEQAQLALEQASAMVRAVHEHLAELDERIRAQTENWRLERMPAVDRNILRLAVWEMVHDPEVPRLVALDEAVELAKRFGAENSGRFVNGLLDGVMRALAAEDGRA